MSEKHKKLILEIYKAPFAHHCGYINDADGEMVADDAGVDFTSVLQMRGWGHLTGRGALGLDHDTAAEIQDELGDMIAEALTQYWNSMEVS